QPALAGSAPIASLLARIESHRTALAAHPQERNAQPILRRPGCATHHAYACLRRDAIPPATDPVLSESFLLTAMSLYLCAAVYLAHRANYLAVGNYTEEGMAAMERSIPISLKVFRQALKTPNLKVVYGTDAVAGAHGHNV